MKTEQHPTDTQAIAEADASKPVEANSRVSPTVLQSVRDRNSVEVRADGEVVVEVTEVNSDAQPPSDMDSAAGKAAVDATAIAAEAAGAKLTSAEAKLDDSIPEANQDNCGPECRQAKW